ncbi:MAG: phospho-sugar mutase [Faecalibacterium sp.]
MVNVAWIESFQKWKTDPCFDEEIRKELLTFDLTSDAKEIEDRFYQELKFGTGGLRAIMGAGTNRMNKYTVAKATMGLGKYLLQTYGEQACAKRGVVIAYDTRNNSELFSKVVADVLSGMGIRAYRHTNARPTPQLSFSVPFLNALAGVVITASHNPKEYNGYKVYDADGCQLVPSQAKQIAACIALVADYSAVSFAGDASLVREVDVTDEFVSAVLKQARYFEGTAKKDLKIVYTPLHGTGLVPIEKMLHKAAFTQVSFVQEQLVADGVFATVKTPNPEDPNALALGIAQASADGADLVLATDPDTDRIAVAVKTGTEYELLTGNQIGALLMDYMLQTTDLTQYKRPAVLQTVVSATLGAEMAREKGIAVFSTLTGFKYIGEKIIQFEEAKKTGDINRNYDFLFAYEESYGYLAGSHAKDKDAVVAALLICEFAAKLKAEGKTLLNRMDELYETFGYYYDALDSITLKGKTGLDKITTTMKRLRSAGSPFSDTAQIIDYQTGVAAEPHFGALPCANVLKFVLTDGSWVAVRPSGTEPKIKIYYSVKAKTPALARLAFEELQAILKRELGLEEV